MNSHMHPTRILICLSLAGLLAACGGGSGTSSPPAASDGSTANAMHGAVHGGQQPVTGSQVTAYAAGNGGFGSSAVPLACTQTDSSGSFSFGGPGAVSCSGSSLPNTFSCPSATCPSAAAEIYLVASGGNPGLAAGTNNTALVLLSALGPYDQTSASTFVNVSELTTVAAVYSLAQMMGSTSSGCLNCGTGISGRLQGALDIGAKSPWLENAFARAASLVNVSNSAPGASLPTASACSGTSQPPNCAALTKLNTLADSLAACVNTAGASSSACRQLFCVATPGATFSGTTCTPPSGGAIPQNTVQSALAIALNPGQVPASGVYSLAGSIPAFAPTLSTVPNDWTLALQFSGGGVSSPTGIAIDAAGNVWVSDMTFLGSATKGLSKFNNLGVPLAPEGFGNPGSGGVQNYAVAIDASGDIWVSANEVPPGAVRKFSNSGAMLSPPSGYTAGGMCSPGAIAIDSSGNAWVSNGCAGNPGRISEFDSNGVALSPASGYADGSPAHTSANLQGIAIDESDAVWFGDNFNGLVRKMNASGTPLTPPGGYSGGGTFQPYALAIDASGNVWIANNNSTGGVSEFSGNGVPLSPLGGYTGGGLLNGALSIAIDGAGNAWVASGGLCELNSSGLPLSPSTGYAAGVDSSGGIAIDGAGNVWVAGYQTSNITEIIGAAAPVKTPLIGPPHVP